MDWSPLINAVVIVLLGVAGVGVLFAVTLAIAIVIDWARSWR